MRTLGFNLNALSASLAATTLAGCGGPQAPVSAPFSSSSAGLAGQAKQSKYRVLHYFQGGIYGDGATPNAGLTDLRGRLYGTTSQGHARGYADYGTVFSITRSGKETVIHGFGGPPYDGAFPRGGLTNVQGTLYGTTKSGCNSYYPYYEDGTVFSIMPSGKETVIHCFGGYKSTPRFPNGGLIYVKGRLYGTAASGPGICYSYGPRDCLGAVFAVTTSGAERAIHYFAGPPYDGAIPTGGLIKVNGTFYGTTSEGGANNEGTIFSIKARGSEKVLHSFGAPRDGEAPFGGLINVRGILYGVTSGGGKYGYGTTFSIRQSGIESVIHNFAGPPYDGAAPNSLINVDGSFYGGTSSGGASDFGTVFAMTPSGAQTILHNFVGSPYDGVDPSVSIYVNGILYGTTSGGGIANNGTIYRYRLSP